MRIVLVHGVLGFGVLGPLEYFNGVKSHLRRTFGAEVRIARVPPIGSIESRGSELGRQILRQFGTGEQVHIVAHSMGGLDGRWALRHVPGLRRRVRTLVTIGTPHHGSPVADAIQAGRIPALLLPAEAIVLELRINQAALHDRPRPSRRHSMRPLPMWTASVTCMSRATRPCRTHAAPSRSVQCGSCSASPRPTTAS